MWIRRVLVVNSNIKSIQYSKKIFSHRIKGFLTILGGIEMERWAKLDNQKCTDKSFKFNLLSENCLSKIQGNLSLPSVAHCLIDNVQKLMVNIKILF